MSVYAQIFLAAAVSAAAGLFVHVVVQRWSTPKLAALTGERAEAARYSVSINIAAYLTAVVSVLVLCVVYYLLAGRFISGNVLIDGAVFSLLVLEIKGNVIRMPFMSWFVMLQNGHPAPLRAMVLQMADQWAAGFTLGYVIVWLCPVNAW